MEMEQNKEDPDINLSSEEKRRNAYFYAIPLLVIVVSTIVITSILQDKDKEVVISDIEKDTVIVDPFENINISAKAAYVYDIKNNKVLYSLNAENQLPLASLTKLITTLIADETLDQNSTIYIDTASIEKEGDSGLFADEGWKVSDLISFTLISSSNDGASALASAITAVRGGTIVEKMNKKVADIGMAQTYFINETGLDESLNFSGAYGSARDVAMLLEYIIRNQLSLLDSTRFTGKEFTSLSGFDHEVENTNTIVDKIPGFLGGKTGFTDLAGGNLAVAFDIGINRPIVVSVLGSTKEGRFEDVEDLVAASFIALSN